MLCIDIGSVFCTGGADDELRRQQIHGLLSGAVDFFQKPFHRDAALLKFALGNSGEMDAGQGGESNVVVAQQGDILRDADALLLRRFQGLIEETFRRSQEELTARNGGIA